MAFLVKLGYCMSSRHNAEFSTFGADQISDSFWRSTTPGKASLYFPRKLRRAMWAGLCAGRGVRPSATAVYLCCLLCATASLTLSTECNCFCTATTAARQVCSKHPLIKRCLTESLSVLLVTRCTATIALPQLLSDKPAPNIRSLSVSSLNRLLFYW